MFEAAKDWVEDKASNLLRTGLQAGGTLAGNAVGGVGSLVENAGNSVGQGVSGGIGGVGNRINGYGEGIKRSMSADGASSAPAKKTAVKPTGAVAQTTTAAPKSVAAGGVKKPAQSTQKTSTGSRPVQQSAKTSAVGTQNRATPARTQQGVGSSTAKSKPVGTTPARTGATRQTTSAQKPASATTQQARNAADGKVRVSPASRPGQTAARPVTRSTAQSSAGKKHDASDPLSLGANFGDMSKGQAKGNHTKSQAQSKPQSQNKSTSTRKASAADPLALGSDIGSIGKKK